jgi:S-adenosylmethionine:tRNA ribosyltransferase-isomerase
MRAMKVSDFNYDLPDELIAREPVAERGTSRLLVLHRDTEKWEDRHYGDFVDYLEPGDVVVLNDTKVIKARLECRLVNPGAERKPERELVVLEKHHADGSEWFEHNVLYRGKLHVGDELTVDRPGNHAAGAVESATADSTERRRAPVTTGCARKCAAQQDCPAGPSVNPKILVEEILGGGIARVRSTEDLIKLTDEFGTPPLPPYLHRDATPEDIKRYQTVFAKDPGSAAAPTASLNMTDAVLDQLRAKGVVVKYLTLHVGLGTFLPIRTENVEDHDIHTEYFAVPAGTIAAIRDAKKSGHKLMAVGTTVTRTLEYVATENPRWLDDAPRDIWGEANIYIYPGYKWRAIDILLTNFHAPKSTVLMLASAFAGWPLLHRAYNHAVREKYHLLSYGDSMLIL